MAVKTTKPPLFKRDIHGDILFWVAEVTNKFNDDGHLAPCHKIIYGKLGNHNSITHYTDCIYGKNIGKKNETSNTQQAIKELDALYKQQMKKGYKAYDIPSNLNRTVPNQLYAYLDTLIPKYVTDDNNRNKPMKCQKVAASCMKYPAYEQPKINGVRTMATFDKEHYENLVRNAGLFDEIPVYEHIRLWSKNGMEYHINHLKQYLYDIFLVLILQNEHADKYILDGEIYIKGQPVTSIGGAARNQSNPLHSRLQFVWFDLAIPDVNQEDRFYKMELVTHSEHLRDDILVCETPTAHKHFPGFHVVLLKPNVCSCDYAAYEYMEECIEQGFEGSILRSWYNEYEFGHRPRTMIKLKKVNDAEFDFVKVKQVIGTVDNPIGFSVVLTLKNDLTDEEFDVAYQAKANEKFDMLTRYYKGELKNAKVTLTFYERTKNQLPFHVTSTTIRDYE